jgi:hypothetical protein
MRRIVSQLLVGVLLVLIAVTVGAPWRRAASPSGRRSTTRRTPPTARGVVVQPALTDELLTGDTEASKEFDDLVGTSILKDSTERGPGEAVGQGRHHHLLRPAPT